MNDQAQLIPQIGLEGLKIQSRIQPEGEAISELLASGVSTGTIQSLYPLDMVQFARHLRTFPFSKQQLLHFVATLGDLTSANAGIVNNMSDADFARLSGARRPFFGAEGLDVVLEMRSISKPEREVVKNDLMVDTVRAAGNILWLCANWPQLNSVVNFSSRLLYQAIALNHALPVGELVKQ